MAHIDYMKIVQYLADTLEANKEINVQYHDNQMNHLDISMTGSAMDEKQCSIILGKFETAFTFQKKYIPEEKISNWVNSLEYYLEQEFKKNIKIEKELIGENYKLLIRH